MQVHDAALSEVKIVVPQRIGDERGFFSEVWNARFRRDRDPHCLPLRGWRQLIMQSAQRAFDGIEDMIVLHAALVGTSCEYRRGLRTVDEHMAEIAATLTPSARGELEITDLDNRYLCQGRLELQMLGRGFAWLDTGTPENLRQAAEFVATIEARQGLKSAALRRSPGDRTGSMTTGSKHSLPNSRTIPTASTLQNWFGHGNFSHLGNFAAFPPGARQGRWGPR